jgi:hypothetical protein
MRIAPRSQVPQRLLKKSTRTDIDGKTIKVGERDNGWRPVRSAHAASLRKDEIGFSADRQTSRVQFPQRWSTSIQNGAATIHRVLTSTIQTEDRIVVGGDIFVSPLVPFIRQAQQAVPSRANIPLIQSFNVGKHKQSDKDESNRLTAVYRAMKLADPTVYVHRKSMNGNDGSPVASGRPTRYTQPPPLAFANPALLPSAKSSVPQEPPLQSPPTRTIETPSQQLDIPRLSEEVYRHIQRKIRVERERRGL